MWNLNATNKYESIMDLNFVNVNWGLQWTILKNFLPYFQVL